MMKPNLLLESLLLYDRMDAFDEWNADLINPYQPPVECETASSDLLTSAAIRTRLARPATALLIMSSIHSVFPAIGLVSAIFVAVRGDLDIHSVTPLIGLALHFVFLLTIAIGAAKMGHLESYRAARLAAFISCIPGLTPFVFFGIPFGIWSILLLNQPAVRAAFPDGPRTGTEGEVHVAAPESTSLKSSP